MADLFQRDKSVIGKLVRNLFKEGEQLLNGSGTISQIQAMSKVEKEYKNIKRNF